MTEITTFARLGAILIIASSAALGTSYAYKLGNHFGAFVGIAFAAMALGGELLKPIAVERAFAAGLRRPFTALACLAVAVVAIAYSLAAELAFSAGARGDLTAGRQAAIAAAAEAKAAAQRADDELARVKPARPLAELEALVAGAREECRIVVNLQGRHTVCSKPASLLAELGRAKRRAELEGQIERSRIVADDNKFGQADPQAAAVVAYLAAAGVTAEPATIATWLHLLPVLLLEIGSAFGLLVARGGEARVPARLAGEHGEKRRLPENVISLSGKRRARDLARKTSARVPRAGKHPVLEMLERAGKPLSVAELAVAMGVSCGEASKRWREVEPQLEVGWSGRYRSIALRRAV